VGPLLSLETQVDLFSTELPVLDSVSLVERLSG